MVREEEIRRALEENEGHCKLAEIIDLDWSEGVYRVTELGQQEVT